MMIKAVLFDLDGTLSAQTTIRYNFDYEILRPFCPDKNDLEFECVMQDWNFLVMFSHYEGDKNLRVLCRRFQLDFDAVSAKMKSEWEKRGPEDFFLLKPDCEEVLKTLKEKGYKLGVVSNGSRNLEERKLKVSGIDKYFDLLLCAEDLGGIRKPDQRIFAAAAERLGVKCEECYFLGDHFEADVAGAYYAKMTPVWVFNDEEKACDYPVRRIKYLKDVVKLLEEEQ